MKNLLTTQKDIVIGGHGFGAGQRGTRKEYGIIILMVLMNRITHVKTVGIIWVKNIFKNMEKIIAELKHYMQTVQDFDKDSAQDASALHAYMIELTNFMARANFLMAEYQRKFREEKKAAYLKLMASSHAQQQYWAPSLGKDFIDSQCSESGYIFDLAERTSRLCSHTLSAVVTIVSSLKSERSFAQYQ